MKKIIAVLVCVALLATSGIVFAACSKQTQNNDNQNSTSETSDISGGWNKADSPVITENIKALFNKAMENRDGITVTPVAYIASQVVAGTNHLVLCKTAPFVPNAKETYALVTLYEDLSGGAEITDIHKSEADATFEEGMTGGFEPGETPVLTDEAKKALEKACEELMGAEYSPVALLSTQVVAGTNYLMLCEMTAVVPNTESEYVIVEVDSDLNGNAEINEIYEFEVEETTQIANPLVDYDSLEEAEKVVGFELSYSESIKAESYTIINGTTLQLNLENDGYLRKAKGREDISGDYNEYEKAETKTAEGKSVTLKGNGGKVMLAIWTDGDYTYCVGITDGISEADMLLIVNAVK